MKQWINPALMLAAFLGAVSGIIYTVRVGESVEVIETDVFRITLEMTSFRERLAIQSGIDASTAAVLDALIRQVDAMDRRMTRNEGDILKNTRDENE